MGTQLASHLNQPFQSVHVIPDCFVLMPDKAVELCEGNIISDPPFFLLLAPCNFSLQCIHRVCTYVVCLTPPSAMGICEHSVALSEKHLSSAWVPFATQQFPVPL